MTSNLLKKDEKELTNKAKRLYKKLKRADLAYHNTDKPIMSDLEYDKLRDKLEVMSKALRRLNPDSKAVQRLEKYLYEDVGAEPSEESGKKVRLPFKVPSLNKVKTDEPKKLKKFLGKFKKASELFISPKLDGSSLVLKYVNGKLVLAFTRGRDGEVGTDVTAHAKLLAKYQVIPKTLVVPKFSKAAGKNILNIKDVDKLSKFSKNVSKFVAGTVYVRGELQINEKLFNKRWKGKEIAIPGEKQKIKLKESRNAANGFINRKKLVKSFAKDLTFFAYGLLNKEGTEYENVAKSKYANVVLLRAMKFTTYLIGPHNLVKMKDPEQLQGELDEQLKAIKNFDYNCDGIVAEIDHIPSRIHKGKGHPEYMFAYKVSTKDLVNQEVNITKVTKVEWNTSKSGALKPLVWYEKIRFGNTQNQKANGVNAANIEKLGIGKGTVVKVVRGGNVIPQILATKSNTRVKKPLPTSCMCGKKIVRPSRIKKGKKELLPDIYCSRPSKCKYLAFKRMVAALKILKVSGISESKLAPIYNVCNYTDVIQLANGKVKKIAALRGFTEKSATKIISDVAKALEKANLAKLAAASGVFVEPGFSLAEKRLTQIVKKIGENKILKVSEKQIRKILGKDGAELECFVAHHSEFVSFVKKVRKL